MPYWAVGCVPSNAGPGEGPFGGDVGVERAVAPSAATARTLAPPSKLRRRTTRPAS